MRYEALKHIQRLALEKFSFPKGTRLLKVSTLHCSSHIPGAPFKADTMPHFTISPWITQDIEALWDGLRSARRHLRESHWDQALSDVIRESSK